MIRYICKLDNYVYTPGGKTVKLFDIMSRWTGKDNQAEIHWFCQLYTDTEIFIHTVSGLNIRGEILL